VDDLRLHNAVAGTFSVAISPASVTVVRGDTATYTVTVQSQGGFNGPVALDAWEEPPYTDVTFTPASVTPPANGSVQATGQVGTRSSYPGTFNLTVFGSNSGVSSQNATASLTVTQAATQLAAPSLLAPANGATGIQAPVTLGWSAVRAQTRGTVYCWPQAPAFAQRRDRQLHCMPSERLGYRDVRCDFRVAGGDHILLGGPGPEPLGAGPWSSISSFTTAPAGSFTVAVSPASQTVAQGNSAAYTGRCRA